MKNIIIVLVVIVAGVLVWYWVSANKAAAPTSPVACTQEAKICPDGSAVSRTGPNCEFAACPE